jgi:hypothetical protein
MHCLSNVNTYAKKMKLSGIKQFEVMRSIYFFLVIFVFAIYTEAIQAQTTVTIGTGTSTDYSNPFEIYFNYGWSSQLYLKSELGAAGSISAIGYYVTNSGSSYTLDNQKVYIRHSSASSFADKYYPGTTGFTLVYSGSITFGSTGWKTIPLSTPFAYNGTDNLEILIESRDGSSYTSAVQTRYTSQAGGTIYRTKYDYNDYSFPATYQAGGRLQRFSNIQFTINTCTNVGGTASASPSSVCTNGSTTLSLTGNIGSPIQWQSSSDNTTFTDIIGATSSSYSATGLTSSKYYRAKIGSGTCVVNSSSAIVSITSSNTVSTASSTPTLCVNSALTNITHTTTGATGIGTATVLPEGVTASWASNTITISGTPTASGTYNYSIPLTGGCGNVSAIGTITVNTYPSNVSISSSATNVTSGTTVTLTAIGATNYSWDNGLGTGATKSVTPIQTTTYTVIADNGNTCTTTESVTVDVMNSSNSGVSTTTVTIGTGTAVDYNIPLQSYFNFGWSSQLYLASELKGAGYLSSLAFYVTNSGSSYTLENQKIYLRHTSASTFTSTTQNYPGTTGFTLVYSGPITINTSGWLTIPFSSVFNYNGTDNLEVLVESRDGSTFTSAIQTRYTNQSGSGIYRTKYDYNNNQFPDTPNQGGKIAHYANIQFVKTSCNLATPIITTIGSVCEGGTLTLSTDSIVGAIYSWTGPNGFIGNLRALYISNVSNTIHTGVYELEVKIGLCSKKVSNSITIKSNTTQVTLLSSDYSVCTDEIVYIASKNTLESDTLSWLRSSNGLVYTSMSNSVNTFLIDSNIVATTYYKLILTKNGCLSESNVVKVVKDCADKVTQNGDLRNLLVNISSIENKIPPYKYQISKAPIFSYSQQYNLIKNALSGISLDSIQFYNQGTTDLSYLFEFDSSPQFISVFDGTGKRIYSRYVYPQKNEIYNSTGIKTSENIVVATSNEGTGLLGNFLTTTNNEYRYYVQDFSKLNYVGFSRFDSLTTSSLAFGFKTVDGSLAIKHQDSVFILPTPSSSNVLLEIYVNNDTLKYAVNGKQVLSNPFVLNTNNIYLDNFSIDKGGVFSEVFSPIDFTLLMPIKTFKPIKDVRFPVGTKSIFNFNNKITVTNNNCFGELGTVSFDISNVLSSKYPPIVNKIEVRNLQNQLITTVNKKGNVFILTDLPRGKYTYKISYRFSLLPNNMVEEGNFEVESNLTWINTKNILASDLLICGNKDVTKDHKGTAITKNVALNDDNVYYVDFGLYDEGIILRDSSYIEFILSWKSLTQPSVTLLPSMNLKVKKNSFESEPYFNDDFNLFSRFSWSYLDVFNTYFYTIEFGSTVYNINYLDRLRYVLDLKNFKIQLKVKGSTGYQLLFEIPINPNNEQFVLNYNTNFSNFGIKQFTGNLTCTLPITYIKLTKDLKGENYKPINDQIGFIHEDEYSGLSDLDYVVYNSTMTRVYSKENLNLRQALGDNRFTINTQSLPEGNYFLEVKDKKGEKYYLRFTK